MDVVHDDHGRGWVWGAGRGIVTVRFETAETPPGPVRSLAGRRPVAQPMAPRLNPTGLTRPQLRALPQVALVDHRHHRVAAGRRVVGQEHHRAAVRRHLHGAEHHALARQLVGASPGAAARRRSRRPIRSESGETVYDVRSEEVDRVTGDPVRPWAGHQPQRPRGRWPRGVDRGRRCRPTPPPAARRRRTTGAGPTRPRVSVEREPSTGSTAIPPATATYERSPEVGGPSPSAPPSGSQTAAPNSRWPSVDGDRARRARHRAPDPVVGAHPEPAQQHLETRRLWRVADDPVRERGGGQVRARRTEAPRGAPSPDRPRSCDQHRRPHAEHLEAHRLTNRTRVPGASRAGSVRRGSQRSVSVWPMICQPPGEATG